MNAYVLIGGESRRMGRSKPAMFLERIVAATRDAFDSVIAVQRAGGEAASLVPTIFEEPHDERAPIFGVLRALEDAADRAFVLAADYPLITSDALGVIASRDGMLVVPVWDGEPQLLCAVYATSLTARIRARIANCQLDLRGLLDDPGSEIIAEHELRARLEGEPLRNVNTPEELEEIHERLQSSR
jgi:molybdopterin-guanine dinucleotide biosynthesis protein A